MYQTKRNIIHCLFVWIDSITITITNINSLLVLLVVIKKILDCLCLMPGKMAMWFKLLDQQVLIVDNSRMLMVFILMNMVDCGFVIVTIIVFKCFERRKQQWKQLPKQIKEINYNDLLLLLLLFLFIVYFLLSVQQITTQNTSKTNQKQNKNISMLLVTTEVKS